MNITNLKYVDLTCTDTLNFYDNFEKINNSGTVYIFIIRKFIKLSSFLTLYLIVFYSDL
jgi:hypothetical protein